MMRLRRWPFHDTEQEGWRGHARYLLCLVVGHRPLSDGSENYCGRCGDVLPSP